MTAAEAAWSAGATLAAPALRVMLRRRAGRGKEIPARLPERFGIDDTPRPSGRLIWMHAASVGEMVSVLPVFCEIVSGAPDTTILMTTGTVTSAALLQKRLAEIGLTGRVIHRFAPLDVPGWVGRFLDHWRPDVGALVESELWPNLLFACRKRGVPLALLNARISDRSFRMWQRAPGMAARMLACFSILQAQSAMDAERLRALGAKSASSPGNLKFAAPPLSADESAVAEAATILDACPRWVAASTHPGEEELIATAHQQLVVTHPGLVTIIVPRHPERGADLARLGARRSLREPPIPGGIWIGDTLGELGLWYRVGPIALLGRSLVPPGGGQNPLEAARLGCAVATGPLTANFTGPVEALQRANALAILPDVPAIVRWVGTMLDDTARREEAGRRAAEAVRGGDALPRLAAGSVLSLLR